MAKVGAAKAATLTGPPVGIISSSSDSSTEAAEAPVGQFTERHKHSTTREAVSKKAQQPKRPEQRAGHLPICAHARLTLSEVRSRDEASARSVCGQKQRKTNKQEARGMSGTSRRDK